MQFFDRSMRRLDNQYWYLQDRAWHACKFVQTTQRSSVTQVAVECSFF